METIWSLDRNKLHTFIIMRFIVATNTHANIQHHSCTKAMRPERFTAEWLLYVPPAFALKQTLQFAHTEDLRD